MKNLGTSVFVHYLCTKSYKFTENSANLQIMGVPFAGFW